MSLEQVITGVVRFKAVQWAEWEEKHESDGYVPSLEELESSSSPSTTVIHSIVCPSDLEAILSPPRFSLDTSGPSLLPTVIQINV